MVLRFVWLYRGSEATVPGPSAHAAVGNKTGGRAVLFRAGGPHNAPTTRGEGRTARAPEARSAAMVVPGQRQTARLAAEKGVQYSPHVSTCRLRRCPSNGPARGNGRPSGQASADAR